MTQQSIGIFLPCRQGSQRVPLKNINPIGKYTLGLFEIKIRQLLAIPNIEIYLSTDDKIIICDIESFCYKIPKVDFFTL